MMNRAIHFTISASLPAHQETLERVASRASRLITALAGIDPLLNTWHQPGADNKPIPLPLDPAGLEQAIYRQSCINGAPRPRLEFGYCLGAVNKDRATGWKPDDLSIMMNAGGTKANNIRLQTGFGVKPNPRLVAFQTIKRIVDALADCFEPRFTAAYPAALDQSEMMGDGTKRPIFPGWMVLLPRALAAQITPPPRAIQRTRDDGSLFLAATDETFDVHNAAHLAASKAIQDAIEPINRFDRF